MCNEQKENPHDDPVYDYRFLNYRLDQLEKKLEKGLSKLEREQNENNKELMKMLHLMQENNNIQNEKLVEINQKQISMEEKMKHIDVLQEQTTTHTTQIQNIHHRFKTYQKIFFILGTATATALITAFFNLLTK